MTEQEMRETEVPTFNNMPELSAYIDSMVNQEHDYGSCVYAMSMAATAAFNYVARKLGVTGFQASCADLDIIRRTRHLDCPFTIITLDKELYPQYDLAEDLKKFREKNRKWIKEKAIKNLAECSHQVHEKVKAHWEKLAAMEIVEKEAGDD